MTGPAADPAAVAVRRRTWWWHALGLAAVLALLVAAGAPGVPYFVDEGGLWLQVEALDEGAWGIPYEFADDDPAWRFRPLARAAATDAGMAPYLRHPLHVVLVTPLVSLAGEWGLLGLSVASVVAVAGLAAGVARRISESSAVAVFWIIGLASPITFHSHLWLAHPLAAAAAGLAVWGAIRVLHGQQAGLAALAIGCAGAAALRSEGLFVGPALAVGFGILWLLRRLSFSSALRSGLVAAVPPVVVLVAERAFVDGVAGTAGPTVQLVGRSSAVLRSINAAFITLLSSSYAEYVVGWLLVAAPIAVYVLAKRSSRAGGGLPLAAGFMVVALLFGARLVLGDVFPVPGLLAAFPLGVAAVAMLERSDAARNEVLLPLIAAGALAVGILATQYEDGGGFEWGWRYFAVGIPFLVPAVAVAVEKARAWRHWRVVGGSAVIMTAVMLAVQVYTVRWFHDLHRGFSEDLAAFAASQELGDRPVVGAVGSGMALVPGLFTADFDRYRWLSAEGGTVEELGAFLATTEVGEFVALRPSGRTAQPGPPWQLVAEEPGSPFDLLRYRR